MYEMERTYHEVDCPAYLRRYGRNDMGYETEIGTSIMGVHGYVLTCGITHG